MPLILPTRRKLIVGAGASLASVHAAYALTTAQKGGLGFGGVPYWVRALTPGAVPRVAADFANDRYWAAGQGNISLSSLLTLTRASNETVTSSSGGITYAANGVPALSNLGLGIWKSSTNLLTYSSDLTNAAWSKRAGALTTDGTLAPDGSTARKFTATSGSGSPGIYQNSAISSDANYAVQFLVKPGTQKYVYLNAASGTANNWVSAVFDLSTLATSNATQTGVGASSGTLVSAKAIYIGGGWFVLQLAFAVATTSLYIEPCLAPAASGNTFGTTGTITFTAAGTEAVYFANPGPGFQAGTFITPYIPTTSSSASQAADQYQIIGALKTIFGGSAGWLFADCAGSNSDNTPTIWDKDNANNTPAYFDTTSTITSVMGGVSLAATLGSGSQASRVKSIVTWDGSGRSLVANGGTVASDSNTLGGTNTPYLGSGGGTNYFYNGNFNALAAGNVRLSDSLAKSIAT